MKYKSVLINIAIILGFMLIVSANVFIQQLSNLDEIWIYNFGRCIINGLLPYKDFSIIITPLFAYISAAFLRLFGDEMIVLRFAEVIQTALILFMVYKILERLKVNKGISLLFSLGLYNLYSSVFCYDYNWAVLLLSLVVIYIELGQEKTLQFNLKKDLAIGIVAGISILLKQTSGAVLATAVIMYKTFEIRDKKSAKEFLNIALTRLLGVLIPVLLFAIYLTANDIWTEFIDYSILGIKTFSNVIPYTRLLESGYILAYVIPIFLSIIIIISIVTSIIKKTRESKWAKDLRILTFFDIATTIVIYPIADRMHFSVGTLCTLITTAYMVNIWFVYGLKIESIKVKLAFNTFFNVAAVLLFIIQIVISTYSVLTHIKSIKDEEYFNHFKYIEVEKNIYEAITKIDEYIENQEDKDVLILDSMAAAINIPIDKYYKNYDMFNLGNFGSKGENGIIEDLKFRKNTLILIKKGKYKTNWQHPNKIIDYVRSNFKHIDEIEVFDVYSK